MCVWMYDYLCMWGGKSFACMRLYVCGIRGSKYVRIGLCMDNGYKSRKGLHVFARVNLMGYGVRIGNCMNRGYR